MSNSARFRSPVRPGAAVGVAVGVAVGMAIGAAAGSVVRGAWLESMELGGFAHVFWVRVSLEKNQIPSAPLSSRFTITRSAHHAFRRRFAEVFIVRSRQSGAKG